MAWPTNYSDLIGINPTQWTSSFAKDLPATFVTEFSNLVIHDAQQEFSVLRQGVREENIRGEYKWYNGMQSTTMTKRTSRYQDTSLTPQLHKNRRLESNIYDIADLIDENDDIFTLIDPKSEYVRAFSMAAGREFDEVICDAFFATVTVKTGQGDSSGATVAFPDDNVIGLSDGANFFEKLRLADKMLRANHASGRKFCAISSVEIYEMFGIEVFTSKDYQDRSPIATGLLPQVMGFTLIPYEDLDVDTAHTYRRCPAWTEGAVVLGIAKNPEVKIDVRPDKNHATQVKLSLGCGAIRAMESSVIEVRTPYDGTLGGVE